ncbi:hypothetical protein [Herbiconiux daphne]|uniref:Uncharacterized protein n=1 Tax=Herbiconiux daphne TaxID=2970914 RepID=A0ABT2H8J0_9MICO|nr:hypothetical protein [Herbiconiux daphne]MCS5736248.1 hypothetical protein [Herbiconiux daphne]
MIIEAGYDVLQLIEPVVHRDDTSRHSLWVLGLDSDLRLLFLDIAARFVQHDAVDYLKQIDACLSQSIRPVRYVVLAYHDHSRRWEPDGWLDAIDECLSARPEFAGRELLGQVVFTDDGYFSTVPRYSFRDYPSLEALPRAAACAGPHLFLDCGCLACRQFEERRDRARRDRLHDESAADVRPALAPQ